MTNLKKQLTVGEYLGFVVLRQLSRHSLLHPRGAAGPLVRGQCPAHLCWGILRVQVILYQRKKGFAGPDLTLSDVIEHCFGVSVPFIGAEMQMRGTIRSRVHIISDIKIIRANKLTFASPMNIC